MKRQQLVSRLARPIRYDLAIIGGGATGLGVALDAAARGLRVLLVESHDFAKGTSSRATKLVHGGVRYLAQGNIALVREALHERATLLRNAPHLVQPQAFKEEVEFILRESARYLSRAPTRADIKSIWVGLRPLVRPPLTGVNPQVAAFSGLARQYLDLPA